MNPRLAAVAGRDVGIGDALGGGDRERPRQSLADFRRAHGGERTDLALAVALEKTAEGAHAGERPRPRVSAPPLPWPWRSKKRQRPRMRPAPRISERLPMFLARRAARYARTSA